MAKHECSEGYHVDCGDSEKDEWSVAKIDFNLAPHLDLSDLCEISLIHRANLQQVVFSISQTVEFHNQSASFTENEAGVTRARSDCSTLL